MDTIKPTVSLLFILTLIGCDQVGKSVSNSEVRVSSQELQQFIQKIKSNLVFVEGGDFLMGDYGSQYGPEKLPYDGDRDSKPLHKVELSSYSIDRYKITNKDFQFYLKYNGLQLRVVDEGNQDDWKNINDAPNIPAHLDWYEADQYCSWLAQISDLPFSLPTEAQWEYAARSRGQFLMVATDDGTYKTDHRPVTEQDGPRGINISTSWDREAYAKQMGWKTRSLTPLPVDRFPPNPLGLYAMSDNGQEWVKDWYDPDYYQNSPVKDPQGPDSPVFRGPASNNKYAKVLRGVSYADPQWGGGVNVQRSYRNPDGHFYSVVNKEELLSIADKTARCVVNDPKL
ncbi:formylglycine-generating enzyme family protein [Pseudomonas sp. LS1212]|uniref:formylglycine-generating enzyme family protein n=1 Tax=Pseudomonas sp. LS1212 TaxID=2972478 RepID=UPI00215C9DC5|nr:formylglycine-generating enzyme family protein [Pseudomonas sp. LS1212]UVJ46134.1 formylglycine-generating enzyme family protein [Pseudomonas sp. LS1212]